MAARSWLHDLGDEVEVWLKWLNKKMDSMGLKQILKPLDYVQDYQDWYILLGWHLLLLVIIFLLVYGWVSSCSWASSSVRELRRRRRRSRREEAASAGARRKRKILRELTPAPPQTPQTPQTAASNLAVLKSPRMEEKRTGKKQPNSRDLHRERHPCGRPLPTSYLSHVARPAIRPETHVSAPTGNRTSDPLMHRLALHRWDDAEDLETFYIWVRPNGQVAEVTDMQVSRFPQSETATQPLEMDKKNEGSKKSTSDAKAVQSCLFHGGKKYVPWWVRLDEGALRQRKPHKM